ncbi:MAG: HepT-like ribonuclease domain-containing protein [Phycisphaerae bacterium]
MQDKSRKLISDVVDAASFIMEQTRAASSESYAANRLLRQAVERNFEIIGEAINSLRRSDPEVAARITDTDRIVAFRNVLSHGYSLVDNAHVWNVIVEALPTLHAEAQDLLNY